MKDIFATRAAKTFDETMQAFVESMQSTYGGACPGCRQLKSQTVAQWMQIMQTPLAKGSAKYGKAVASLTSTPASVRHALAYRDVAAMHASVEYMQPLDLPSKLSSMSTEDANLFWEYLNDLTRNAYAATRTTPVAVPSSAEIAADIARRRQNKPAADSTLHAGVAEAWAAFCTARGVEIGTDDALRLVAACAPNASSSDTEMVKLCRARDETAGAALARTFSQLPTTPMDDGDWGMLDRVFAMATMQSNIPAPMLRGIEKMASSLAADIGSGAADLSKLDIEAIGERVLAGVSQGEVDAFAQNLDRILPAIQRMQ